MKLPDLTAEDFSDEDGFERRTLDKWMDAYFDVDIQVDGWDLIEYAHKCLEDECELKRGAEFTEQEWTDGAFEDYLSGLSGEDAAVLFNRVKATVSDSVAEPVTHATWAE